MGADVRRAALTAVLAMSAGLLAACSGSGPPANLISVSNGGCGGSWQLAEPGWHTFEIYNATAEGGEVDLIDPANGAIYAEVERSARGRPADAPGRRVGPLRLPLPVRGHRPDDRAGGDRRRARERHAAIVPVTNNELVGRPRSTTPTRRRG